MAFSAFTTLWTNTSIKFQNSKSLYPLNVTLLLGEIFSCYHFVPVGNWYPELDNILVSLWSLRTTSSIFTRWNPVSFTSAVETKDLSLPFLITPGLHEQVIAVCFTKLLPIKERGVCSCVLFICSIFPSQQPVRLANVCPCQAQGESGAEGGGHVWANIGLGHICCPYQEPEWCYWLTGAGTNCLESWAPSDWGRCFSKQP